MLRDRLLSVEAFKDCINFTRAAAYPDIDKFERDRDSIEQAWPAYAQDVSLSRPSSFFAPRTVLSLPAAVHFPRAMTMEEQEWARQYKERLQHVICT